jgi:3-oxoacyl-[acyl-carrier protein] reductase
MLSLDSKCVFVTGGSRGIGAGLVRGLAELGARVGFSYTSQSDAAQVVLKSLKGAGHFCLPMDVKSAASVEAGFKKIFEHFEQLDGLVNNAGITRDQLLLRMKDDDFDEVLATNLRGTYLCSKLAIKAMIRARQGSIVNITSVIGSSGNAGQSNYAASKAGTEGFSRALALEVASRNVRINCVAPGFIATEMTEILDDDRKNSILTRVPLNRMGRVEDVVGPVAFLLSEQSSYVTGQTLHVNGGLYL